MPLRLLRCTNMSHLCTSLHHFSFFSPTLLPKRLRTPLDAPQIRTLRGGPAPFKATLNVSSRVSKSSPVVVPLQHQHEEEEEAAATDFFAAGEMHIPLDKLFIPPGVDASQLQTGKRLQGSNIVLSPYAKGAQIKQAEFIKSSSSVEECPTNGYPEFALVGRSNVGKSSLVNALVRRKQLAMTSKKPGKTQLINHFLINDSWYLVDLPGYGAGQGQNKGDCDLRNRLLDVNFSYKCDSSLKKDYADITFPLSS